MPTWAVVKGQISVYLVVDPNVSRLVEYVGTFYKDCLY